MPFRLNIAFVLLYRTMGVIVQCQWSIDRWASLMSPRWVVASEKGRALRTKALRSWSGGMSVENHPPGRHITDERPRLSYRGWFYKMQTSALVLEDLLKVQYQLFEFDEMADEPSETCFKVFDIATVDEKLSQASKVVFRLGRIDDGPVWFDELSSELHRYWCTTFWFGSCVENRALAIYDRYPSEWLIANDPYALISAFDGPSKNIKATVDATGSIHHIDFDQALEFPEDSRQPGVQPTSGLLHFRVERIEDYIVDRKLRQQDTLYSYVPDWSRQFHYSRTSCYQNESTAW
jgi:hypothetical protein